MGFFHPAEQTPSVWYHKAAFFSFVRGHFLCAFCLHIFVCTYDQDLICHIQFTQPFLWSVFCIMVIKGW